MVKIHGVLPSERKVLDRISDQLGVKKQEDWYSFGLQNVQSSGGHSLISRHNNSTFHLLRHLYGEFEWKPFLFPRTPRNHWSEKKNHRKFLDWISEQFGVEMQEDWYRITGKEVKSTNGVAMLCQFYNGSLLEALECVYSEFEWTPMNFYHVPNNHWEEKKNQRQMLDWIGEQLNVQLQEDWYSFETEEVMSLGRGVGRYYSGSLFSTLQSVYEEFEWNPLLFDHNVPKNHWKDKRNQRNLLDSIGEQMGVKKQSDWYSFSGEEVKSLGASGLITEYYNNSLFVALKGIYEEFTWNPLEIQNLPKYYWREDNQKNAASHSENAKDLLISLEEKFSIDNDYEWLRLVSHR